MGIRACRAGISAVTLGWGLGTVLVLKLMPTSWRKAAGKYREPLKTKKKMMR